MESKTEAILYPRKSVRMLFPTSLPSIIDVGLRTTQNGYSPFRLQFLSPLPEPGTPPEAAEANNRSFAVSELNYIFLDEFLIKIVTDCYYDTLIPGVILDDGGCHLRTQQAIA